MFILLHVNLLRNPHYQCSDKTLGILMPYNNANQRIVLEVTRLMLV
jgi:hypothetical protein